MNSISRIWILFCLLIGIAITENRACASVQGDASAFKVTGIGNDFDGTYRPCEKATADGAAIYTNGTRFYDTGTNQFHVTLADAEGQRESKAIYESPSDLELSTTGEVQLRGSETTVGLSILSQPTPGPENTAERVRPVPIKPVPVEEEKTLEETSESSPASLPERIKAKPIPLEKTTQETALSGESGWLAFLRSKTVDPSPRNEFSQKEEEREDPDQSPKPAPKPISTEAVVAKHLPSSKDAPDPPKQPETPAKKPIEIVEALTKPNQSEVPAQQPATGQVATPEPATTAVASTSKTPDAEDAVPPSEVAPPKLHTATSPEKALLATSGEMAGSPTAYVTPHRSSWRNRYELGPGDELNFGLQGKPTLNKLAVAVAPDGTVSFLQAKQVDVRGKTIDEVRNEMNQILAGYHRNAKTIITPSKLGSKRYTVLGEVRKNGTYSLDRPTTLLNALAEAGGFNLGKSGEGAVQLADLQRSFVVRNNERLNIDMESLYLAGDMTQNVHIEPGDYVYIASKLRNEVYVFGAVNNPGVKPIESRMTTLGAIASAEGFGSQAWRDRVLIIRGKMDSPETIVMPLNKVLHGKAADIELLPGDIVYVHNRPWAYATKILDAAILAYIDGSFAGWLADDGNIAVTSGG